MQRFAADHLRAHGFEVVAATSGPEALTELEKLERIDLLFTDVIMPGGMNGVQLAQWARERRPGIRLMLFSGWTADTVVSAPPDVPILQKPFDMSALKRAIERLAR